MPSDSVLLPRVIRRFWICVTRSDSNIGSGRSSRLAAVADAGGVEGPTDDLVADARQVLHSAPTDEHDRVLLEVVTDAGDVSGDFDSRGEANTSDLTQSGVGLLRRGRVDAGTDAAPLRR